MCNCSPVRSRKTTLCNLFARFWDVQEDSICIGRQSVKNYTADSVLDCINMVFHKIYLFNDTIKNNIKFDMPKATLDEVMEAAKKLAAMISLCLCLMNIRPWLEKVKLHYLAVKIETFYCPGNLKKWTHRHFRWRYFQCWLDQIIVIYNGQVRQKGTHKRLRQEDGIYKNFLKFRVEASGWQL